MARELLRLRCAEIEGDHLTVETCDEEAWLVVCIYDHMNDQEARQVLDKETARLLFNRLGVWLHQ